jgi:hypothetical protein
MRELSIKLSVSLTDGSYESSISVPVDAPKGRFEELAAAWLDMMRKALALVESAPRSNVPLGKSAADTEVGT